MPSPVTPPNSAPSPEDPADEVDAPILARHVQRFQANEYGTYIALRPRGGIPARPVLLDVEGNDLTGFPTLWLEVRAAAHDLDEDDLITRRIVDEFTVVRTGQAVPYMLEHQLSCIDRATGVAWHLYGRTS